MKLISSAEAVNFLSQAAPRPWVKRMLRWMIVNGELDAFCTKGSAVASTNVYNFTMELSDAAGERSGPKMDAAIREHFGDDFAEKLVGKDPLEKICDEPQSWDQPDSPVRIPSGFLSYADEVNFELGEIFGDFVDMVNGLPHDIYEDSEILATEFERPEYEYNFSGMCFLQNVIEMLLPSAELTPVKPMTSNVEGRRSIGRPQKWDWDGAMAHIVAEAQTPDGLPTGAGAQAKIEAMMQAWFIDQFGDAPATSQIRRRASTIIQSLERPKTPKSE